MQPLEGARVLVLSSDPSVVEPLVAALERDGADVIFRDSASALPDPESLDAAVFDPASRAAEAEALGAYVNRLPESVVVLDAGTDTHSALRRQLEPASPSPAWTQSRLTRSALTVLAVTAVLWLASRAPFRRSDDLPAVTPAAAGIGQPGGGTGALAGRVTKTGTNEPLPGAAVVASGPSGPISTTTDAQGRWRFAELRGGRYVVMTTAPRHVAKQQQVDVPEGRAVENVNFSLDPEAP